MHDDPRRNAEFGIVRRGPVSIHFNRGEQARLPSRLSEGAYDLYFNLINLDSLTDELRARRADILDGPEAPVYGQRELIVRDCNDFVLAFGGHLKCVSSDRTWQSFMSTMNERVNASPTGVSSRSGEERGDRPRAVTALVRVADPWRGADVDLRPRVLQGQRGAVALGRKT